MVRGLTRFMADYANTFLERYELHDTYLVIDGNNVLRKIYIDAKLEPRYGGDYDKYARSVENFFDALFRCNIKPLVLFKGEYKSDDLPQVLEKVKRWVSLVEISLRDQPVDYPLPALLLYEVFKKVLIEKRIPFACTLSGGSMSVARVAKILDCPVLSFVSHYYIYDILYISYEWFSNHVYETKTGCKMYCKIFKPGNMKKAFPGLESSLLPIALTLLGDKYIDSNCFSDLFDSYYTPSGQKYENRKFLIKATFQWLSEKTPEDAIDSILSHVREKHRQKVLEAIQENIRSYEKLPLYIFQYLGIPRSFIDDLKTKFALDMDEVHGLDEETKLLRTFPEWSLRKICTGVYPRYTLKSVCHRIHIPPTQMEDLRQQPIALFSRRIIGAIDKMLVSLIDSSEEVKPLDLIVRAENVQVHNVEFSFLKLDPASSDLSDVPSLFELETSDLETRRSAFNKILEIPDGCLDDLPKTWRIYFVAIVNWMRQDEVSLKSKLHLDCLLYALLFNVIDEKLGFERDEIKFQKKYGHIVKEIREKNGLVESNEEGNQEVDEIYRNVSQEDCIMATTFFLYYFEPDCSEHRIDISTVHVYSHFQYCLMYINDLNALCGFPYPQSDVSKFFNGTLIYNLNNVFSKPSNFENYVKRILRFSPSLLRLFQSIQVKVQNLLGVGEEEVVIEEEVVVEVE